MYAIRSYYADYDHAYVRASTDGASWVTVWENTEEITDSAWTQIGVDISSSYNFV